LRYCWACFLLPAIAAAIVEVPPEVRIYSAAWFPPNLTISATANLVELAAIVHDRDNHPVSGLKAADFEVLDNKQPQQITHFAELRGGEVAAGSDGRSVGTDAAPAPTPDPRTIALFFDDAHGNDLGLRKSAEAAEKLIGNDLRAGDRVGIFTASGAVSVDFIGDRDALLAALKRIIPRPLSGPTPFAQCPQLSVWEAYAIVEHVDPSVELPKLAEAAACACPQPITIQCRNDQRIPLQNKATMIWVLSEFRSTTTLDAIGIVMRHLGAAPGKRILLLMTPAFPAEKGMESQISELMNAALRAQIRVSTMQIPGKGVPSAIARLEFLGQAAKATGGQFVDGYYDPSSDLRKLVSEPDVSYMLGFSPAAEPDGQTHTLRTVVPGNRGYTVEARTAYFAAKAAGESAQQRIDRIALSNDEMHEFPASVSTRQEQGAIHVKIAVDAKALKFPEKEGRRVEELTLLTVLEDAQGRFVAGKESVMDLALLPATLAEKLKKGIEAEMSFAAPPAGAYRVREVIREAAQNRVWAGAAAITVR
jgi:VWFA-related protein